jgi:hypothetical protein
MNNSIVFSALAFKSVCVASHGLNSDYADCGSIVLRLAFIIVQTLLHLLYYQHTLLYTSSSECHSVNQNFILFH